MARRGRAPIVLSRRVELLPQAAPIYQAYLWVDRDGFNGRPLFAGMRAVLDELGIVDREERKAWFDLWRRMSHVESEVRDKQAKEREKRGPGGKRTERDEEA